MTTNRYGTTYDEFGPTKYISVTGKAYDSLASADAAGKAYKEEQAFLSRQRGFASQAGAAKAGTGPTSGADAITSEFLKTWGGINDEVMGLLRGVIGDIDKGVAAGSSQIQDLIKTVRQQADDYETKYGGLETDAIAAAREDISAKRDLTKSFMDLSQPDYEGVTGRAVTDVRGASARGREAEAMEAMSFGIDPSSDRFGALTKKSFLAQAMNEAIASNLARRSEKDRVANMVATGIQIVDPSESTNIAQGVQTGRAGFTGMEAGLTQTDAYLRNAALASKANVAGGIANIGRDYGSAGLAMLGLQQGKASGSQETAPATTGEAKAYTPMPGSNLLSTSRTTTPTGAPAPGGGTQATGVKYKTAQDYILEHNKRFGRA